MSIFKDNIEIIVWDVIDKIWQDSWTDILSKNPFHLLEINIDRIEEMDEEYTATKWS